PLLRLTPLLFLLLAGAACATGSDATPYQPRQGTDYELPVDSRILPGRVPGGATLESILNRHNLAPGSVERMITAVRAVFDPRKVRQGQAYRLERLEDGRVRFFEYEIDATRFLRLLPAGDDGREFRAEVVDYPITTTALSVGGTIDERTPSLFASMSAAGEQPELSIALADIFSGEVDFNSELQPGDEYRIATEKSMRDGRIVGYGPIEAARLKNGTRELVGIRFQPEGKEPGYYDLEGRSLKRFFLRSPLKFDPSISSHFSRSRRHPILNIRRAHLGVDYRAPSGAPVVAVSAGTVVFAAWTRGGGRTVRIRHASGYETAYLHLSSFGPGIHAGVRVAQGQIIGRVGATGLATGPHLHYELRKNGRHVNPVLEHRKLPPGDPVPPDQMDEFRAVRDRALAKLG
ncbi:MAG TPA: M23 family metallopeptidase, partial [Vicinamibacterales bacterium]